MIKHYKLFKLFKKFSSINKIKNINSIVSLLEDNNGVGWWIDNSMSNIFQDTVGTIKANEINDEIGLVKSYGKKIENATQSNINLKPILCMDNNKYLIDFINPNSVLETTCVGDKAANFVLIAAGYTNKLNNAVIAGCMEPTARSYLGINSQGFIGAGIDGVTYDNFNSNIKWDIPHVVTLIRRNHTAYLRIDGILIGEYHLTSGGSNMKMYIGAVNNNNVADKHWNGKIGFVAGMLKTMTDLEISLMEQFAAKKIGIII